MSKPFSLLIKPASAGCNLRCGYCFYLEKSALFGADARMDENTLETMTRLFLATEQDVHGFAWQGGEPTLMGLAFFQKAVEYQKRYGSGPVSNALQTNGTLLDDAFAAFLAEYKFLVGISLDGPADIHDKYRLRADGGGSHEMVLRGMEMLKKAKVEYNVLTLVSESNASSGGEVYRYLRDMGVYYQQYIPCVNAAPGMEAFAVTGEQFGAFLLSVFEEWLKSDVRTVSVRFFDSVVHRILSGASTDCTLAGDCRNYLVVEHDGGIYPCDFYVQPDLRLGSVRDPGFSFEQMLDSGALRAFARQKSDWGARCAACEYLTYCSGDCTRNRMHGGVSVLCEGYRMFYKRALPELIKLARGIARGAPLFIDSDCPRNAPCFCGSEKKYKKCHGTAPPA